MTNTRNTTIVALLGSHVLCAACEQKSTPKPAAQDGKVESSARSAGEAAGKAAAEGTKAADQAAKAAGEAAKEMPKDE